MISRVAYYSSVYKMTKTGDTRRSKFKLRDVDATTDSEFTPDRA